MGKTTLGRFLESASQNLRMSDANVKVHFTRVSYDMVFSKLQLDYVTSNPEADQVAAFDLIRPKADEVFME